MTVDTDDIRVTEHQATKATFINFESPSNGMAFSDNLAGWDLSFSSNEFSSSLCPAEESHATQTKNTNSSEPVETSSRYPNGNDQRHSEAALPPQQQGNHLEAWVEQLAGLNISLFRSARHIASPDNAPLTVISPHINGLFEATSTLINIMDSLGQHHATDPTSTAASVESSPKRTTVPGLDDQHPTADHGLIFLILACQQQLLGVFEMVCLSVQRHLISMAGASTGPSPSQSGVPADGQSFTTTREPPLTATLDGGGAPSMAQFVMVMQLLSHLLNRLDRALGSLAEDADSLDEDGTIHDSNVGQHEASWGQFQEVNNSPQDLAVGLLSHRTRENAQRRGSQGILETARVLVDGMKHRHTSLQQEIEVLQKRIERSRIL